MGIYTEQKKKREAMEGRVNEAIRETCKMAKTFLKMTEHEPGSGEQALNNIKAIATVESLVGGNLIPAAQEAMHGLIEGAAKVMLLHDHAVAINTALIDAGVEDYEIKISVQTGQLQGVLVHHTPKHIRDILPVLRAARRAGYVMQKVEEYAEVGRRSYHFATAREGKAEIIVSFFFPTGFGSLGAEGATCRYVQDGVEETPKYKLVCDDGTEVEA